MQIYRINSDKKYVARKVRMPSGSRLIYFFK